MLPLRPLTFLYLTFSFSSVWAAGTAGSFADGGNTLVSALLMFLGNDESVYIIDKAEGNAAHVAGHPAWGARWDIATHQAEVMDIKSNSFCSSGSHLPNGSFVNLGGNDGITINGQPGSSPNPDGTGAWDQVYQDFDGRKAIRILDPCGSADDITSPQCSWFDDSTLLAMQAPRWYAAVEPTGDGTLLIVGGFTAGGYINRLFPGSIDPNNYNPVTQNNQAQNTYEYFPAKAGVTPPVVNFLVQTSGLNAYVHIFQMPSGKMFVQANHSTMLWDHTTNTEFPLPDMPNGVVRVYPASGGVAMLPLTPANNYTPTILFCGGQAGMSDNDYGDYGSPRVPTWTIPASNDCQRITPEPQDNSAPAYIQDDNMLEGRTMGQFIILPDATMLMINGGSNGTAGYFNTTTNKFLTTAPFGESLASGPVFTPAIYNPNAPAGSRWSNKGLSASTIPRLYHSSAILLPDASVLIAGSNPNSDVVLNSVFNTEYRAEIFYPPYFAGLRPSPTGMPKTLTYGGTPFDITIPSSSYTGLANDAANATVVSIIRGGYTTHAMNFGQRYLQLANSYTVNKDASITLHVAQPPPIPNIFQPGPALLFVTINGIPSNGTYVIVGSGKIETQATAPASVLPAPVRLDNIVGGASANSTGTGSNSPAGTGETKKKSNLVVIIAAIAGALVLLAAIVGLIAIIVARRRRSAARLPPSKQYNSGGFTAGSGKPITAGWSTSHDTDSSVFVPLAHAGKYDDTWDPRTGSIHAPYMDAHRATSSIGSGSQVFDEYDPYSGRPPQRHAGTPEPRMSGGMGGSGYDTPPQSEYYTPQSNFQTPLPGQGQGQGYGQGEGRRGGF